MIWNQRNFKWRAHNGGDEGFYVAAATIELRFTYD